MFTEADFRCPDESGWQPSHQVFRFFALPFFVCWLLIFFQPISKEDADLKKQLKSQLPIPKICSKLRGLGYTVSMSNDPGRFVCNYTYYHSLSTCVSEHERSIFLHCPPFDIVPENRQLDFIRSFILILASEVCTDISAQSWPVFFTDQKLWFKACSSGIMKRAHREISCSVVDKNTVLCSWLWTIKKIF